MKLCVSLIQRGMVNGWVCESNDCEPIKTPCTCLRGPIHVQTLTNTCNHGLSFSKDQKLLPITALHLLQHACVWTVTNFMHQELLFQKSKLNTSLRRSCNIKHESTNISSRNLKIRMNRSKQESTSKIQTSISSCTMDHFTRFKAQHDHNNKIYKYITRNLRIKRIDL